jgi:flagellar motor protein MotB
MMRKWFVPGMVLTISLMAVQAHAFGAAAAGSFYDQGQELYKAGRYSEATDAFEQAVKKRDHARDAQDFIDRIRKETVERIRNKALTGISKANWQSKYYFMNIVEGRVRVGISSQEMFERGSLNFRPGAVDALAQLAEALSKADNTRVDIELINEINQDTAVNPEIVAQQLDAVFSYLSLAARDNLPKY